MDWRGRPETAANIAGVASEQGLDEVQDFPGQGNLRPPGGQA